jgi:alkylation response protein AidB-like acyl-CoA dehydrogenase
MNFYSEEHELVRNTARKFAEKHLKPGVIERDENAEFRKNDG